MGDPIQLEPFDVATDEDELRRRREAEARRALDNLTMPQSTRLPSQQDVEAQAMGDAYREMPDAEADAIQARSRDTGPGGRVYAAGDIPPSEPQRQRMMDRGAARGSAAVAGQMAALDAPTERQRPHWMRDREDPRGELDNDVAAQRASQSSAPPAQQLIDRAPTPTTTPAGGAASPSASPPAGRDYTGADVGDAVQAAALMFSNILAAARGDQPSGLQFRSQGRELRERDRVEALAQRQRGEAADMRREELAAARADRQQQAASTDMYRQRQLEIQDQLAQGRLSEMAARELTVRNAAEEQRAMRDPSSPISASWRQLARDTINTLPAAHRQLWERADLDHMSGEMLQRFIVPLERRGIRGSAGGGGGGPRAGSPDAEGVIADAVASGIPERTARAMYANPRTRGQLMQRIAAHPGEGGAAPGASANGTDEDPLVQEALRQGVPPVTARNMARDPDERARLQRMLGSSGISNRRADQAAGSDRDVMIAAAQDAVAQVEQAMPPPGQDIPGVGTVDSLRGGGFFQSAEGRRMRSLALNAVRRFLRLESGGAIGDQEAADEMEARGMGPGATEQQFRDGMRDLRRDLEVRAGRRERGSGNQGAQPATAPQAQDGMVPMINPAGEPRRVPAANVARAEAAGWRRR